MTRICKSCGFEYPNTSEYFYVLNSKKGTLHPRCKKCTKIKQFEDYAARRDQICEKRRIKYAEDSSSVRESVKRSYEKRRDSVCQYNREYRSTRKEQIRQYNIQYYRNNKDKLKAYYADYRSTNREKLRVSARIYYINNKDYCNAYSIKYKKSRSLTDLRFRVTRVMRNVVRRSIKALIEKPVGESSLRYVDYTVDDFKTHLESLFEPGMTWENYGEWHVDHIIPVSAFEYDSYEHPNFKRCWALTNLQPLWSKDNLSKGAKCDQEYIDAAMIRVTHALLKRLS